MHIRHLLILLNPNYTNKPSASSSVRRPILRDFDSQVDREYEACWMCEEGHVEPSQQADLAFDEQPGIHSIQSYPVVQYVGTDET